MLSEMLRLSPLSPLLEAAEQVFLRNRQTLYQNVLVPKSHLRDPCALNSSPPLRDQGQRYGTVTAKTVKPPPASPLNGTGRDMSPP